MLSKRMRYLLYSICSAIVLCGCGGQSTSASLAPTSTPIPSPAAVVQTASPMTSATPSHKATQTPAKATAPPASVLPQRTPVSSSQNPIDLVFDPAFASAGSTAEIDRVSEKYYEAWRDEANAAVMAHQSIGNRAKANQQLSQANRAAEAAADKAFGEYASEDGIIGSGAASASLLARAAVYKELALELIDQYNRMSDTAYAFAYVAGDVF